MHDRNRHNFGGTERKRSADFVGSLLSIVVAALAGGVLSTLAAAATLRLTSSWIPRLVSFAVGALLGAVFLELLPHALEDGGVHYVMLIVLIGLLAFFLLEKLVLWRHCHTHDCEAHGLAAPMVIIGDAFHNFLDGVVIGTAVLVSIPLGISTALAVMTHEIPQELGDFAILLQAGYSRRKALVLNIASGLSAIGGAICAILALDWLPSLSDYVLAVAAASFGLRFDQRQKLLPCNTEAGRRLLGERRFGNARNEPKRRKLMRIELDLKKGEPRNRRTP